MLLLIVPHIGQTQLASLIQIHRMLLLIMFAPYSSGSEEKIQIHRMLLLILFYYRYYSECKTIQIHRMLLLIMAITFNPDTGLVAFKYIVCCY